MDEEGIRELGLDIKNNGQKDPIILFQDRILDGRNRYLACKMYSIIPIYKELEKGVDPEKYVLSRNLYRRHLNTAQRCEIALKLLKIERKKAKIRQSQTQFKKKKNTSQDMVGGKVTTIINNHTKGKSIEISAKKAQISTKTLKKARKIKDVANLDPKVKEKWEKAKQNKLSIESIYRGIKQKESKQEIKKEQRANSKKSKEGEFDYLYIKGSKCNFLIMPVEQKAIIAYIFTDVRLGLILLDSVRRLHKI
jgi:hypothetical protein